MNEPRTAYRATLDMEDRLQKAVELINCIIMATSSLADREKMNAIASVGYSAVEVIEEVQGQLVPEVRVHSIQQEPEGRAA